MNAHARHNTKDLKPVRNLAVDRIVSDEFFPEPLMDAVQDVYEAFLQLTTDKARPVRTNKVTEASNYKNADFVRGKLWELARNGYIAAYRKNGKWLWCHHECVARMLKVEPQLKWSYEQLEKRQVIADWDDNGKPIKIDGQPI